MEWLANAFWAKIGWFLGELALAVAVVVTVVVLAALVQIPRMIRQARCRHLHYFETGKCDAICSDCHKNLGFIGRIRDQR